MRALANCSGYERVNYNCYRLMGEVNFVLCSHALPSLNVRYD